MLPEGWLSSLWVLLLLLSPSLPLPFEDFTPCQPSDQAETRVLHVVTCDTRSGAKSLHGGCLSYPCLES